MASAHKLLHGLPEVAKYLGYDPRRLALAERAGANQVGYEFLMRLYCARHHSRMADPGAGMQDSCPQSGKNLAFAARHLALHRIQGVGACCHRRSRHPRSQRSTNPAAASPPRQRITVSKSTPAAIAIRAGPLPPRAGTASSTRVLSGSRRSRGSTGFLGWPGSRPAGPSAANSSISITSRALVTHTAPQSLIMSWQPADCADVTGPGTAISGLPRSWACR